MKNKTKAFSIVLFLSVFIMLTSFGGQKQKWKGKIEVENGIKVIKNPKEPLYGEITFDLKEDLSIGSEEDDNYFFSRGCHMAVDRQGNIYVLDDRNTRIQVFDKEGQYLRTIGRRGQGPGEFHSPHHVFVNDQNAEIFVPDFRSIKVFTSSGDYLRTIPLESYNRSYCISSGGAIIGETEKLASDKNNIIKKRKYLASLRFINSTDGSETVIASYPDQLSKIIEGRVGKFDHGYEHRFQMCAIGPQTFVYGFSSDYELNIIDSTGNLLFKIQKESPPLSISKKEKDAVREKYRDSPIKNVNNIPFPKHKPYYGDILSDGDWIFMMQHKSPQDKREVWFMDIFDEYGYYLYKSMLPVRPQLIQNGFVYIINSSDDTGNIRIKRFQIKNWEQIKKGI